MLKLSLFRPPTSIRRLSSGISASKELEEELINAYETEADRITNVLSRKLEQLRVAKIKIELENVLEAESENDV
ncbi:hypothetical protein EV361DRAFT_897325 [Lentinula raphanica]|nr:hypothetical protein EV361DRAFT_897325 [Lentinula raphanica]